MQLISGICGHLVFVAVLLPLLVLGENAKKSPAEKEPIAATVCEIVEQCRKFDGKRVILDATVLSDGFEHTVLVDPNCKVGIVPYTSERVNEHADIQAFDEALEGITPTTQSRRIQATFVGRFSCDLSASSVSKRRVLQVEEIRNLKVTSEDCDRK